MHRSRSLEFLGGVGLRSSAQPTLLPEPDRYGAYCDEAWKHVLERFFPELLQFFLPALARDVDFTTPITFLDKELEQLAQTSLSVRNKVHALPTSSSYIQSFKTLQNDARVHFVFLEPDTLVTSK